VLACESELWELPISDVGCLCTLSGASSDPSSAWTLLLLQGWEALALRLTGSAAGGGYASPSPGVMSKQMLREQP